MNKKLLIWAFCFAFAAALFCGGAWVYQHSKNNALVRGEFAFAETRNNLKRLGHVQMITPDSGEINLYRRDGLWYFKEAKDYFVNVERLADFFKMMNTAMVERVIDENVNEIHQNGLEPQSGTILKTYDLDGKLLDDVIIGKRTDKNSAFVRSTKTPKYFYIVSSVGAFSGQPMDWVPYPLLSIEHNLIHFLVINGRKLNRAKVEERILRSPAMRRLILALQYMDYVGLINRKDLLEDKTITPEKKTIKVGVVGGLIYDMDIYRVKGTYWIGITLRADKIARREVRPFVEQNQKYFSDWLFQLDNEQGKILFDI